MCRWSSVAVSPSDHLSPPTIPWVGLEWFLKLDNRDSWLHLEYCLCRQLVLVGIGWNHLTILKIMCILLTDKATRSLFHNLYTESAWRRKLKWWTHFCSLFSFIFQSCSPYNLYTWCVALITVALNRDVSLLLERVVHTTTVFEPDQSWSGSWAILGSWSLYAMFMIR